MGKERGISFNSEMVRAVLDGRKTQTRRIMEPQPSLRTIQGEDETGMTALHWATPEGLPFIVEEPADLEEMCTFCPYGKVGDKLWVRETWFYADPEYHYEDLDAGALVPVAIASPEVTLYRADYTEKDDQSAVKWKPSIHMPRWASRITLEITDVRVERIADTAESDALAEGFHFDKSKVEDPLIWFHNLWNSIYSERGYGWETNPWVWVIEFKAVE